MVEGLKGGLRRLTLRPTKLNTNDGEDHDAINTRFHGKSSLVALIDATRRYKELHISDTLRRENEFAEPAIHTPFKRPEFWLAHPVNAFISGIAPDSQMSSGNYNGKGLKLMLTNCLFLF